MKANELDEIFDRGEDITPYLDLSTAERPGHQQEQINIDFPEWMINSLDFQAHKMGIARQAVIKLWIADRIKVEKISRSQAPAWERLPSSSA